MCLAVPGKVLECTGDEAVVDLQGNTLRVSRVLTPDAAPGDWVLIHAGFTITRLDEAEARETWDYLRQTLGDDALQSEPPAPAGGQPSAAVQPQDAPAGPASTAA